MHDDNIEKICLNDVLRFSWHIVTHYNNNISYVVILSQDAMWPVSRPASSSRPSSSQGVSVCPGNRTPPEESGSVTDTKVGRISPKAIPEQFTLSSKQTSMTETASSHHQADGAAAQTSQEERGGAMSKQKDEQLNISGDNDKDLSQVTAPTSHASSHDNVPWNPQGSQHHHHHGRRPSMIESIISRVFSHHSSASSSSHHDHHGRRQSIIEVILNRVHSITHPRRSNQVLPITDDDSDDDEDEDGDLDEVIVTKQEH